MFQRADLVRHVNGTVYVILHTPDHVRIEATNEPGYAYVKHDEPGSTIWIRSQGEMEDGRFTKCGVHESG